MKENLTVVGMFACVIGLFVLVVINAVHNYNDRAEDAESTVTPVQCSCSCPETKCPASVVADGYNVSVSVNGEKYGRPLQGAAPSSMYCRVEDVDTLERMGPDMTLTKCWEWLDGCSDDLRDVRSGFDDEANQCCWQQQAF